MKMNCLSNYKKVMNEIEARWDNAASTAERESLFDQRQTVIELSYPRTADFWDKPTAPRGQGF